MKTRAPVWVLLFNTFCMVHSRTLALTISLTLGLAASFIPASAAEVETVFDPTTQRLLLPHLVIGDKIYWVELELVDAATFDFRIDAKTAIDLTPDSNYVTPAADALVGSWLINLGAAQQFAGGEFRMTFASDGTYEFVSGGRSDDPCGPGVLTGNFAWEPRTGVILASRDQTGDICELAPSSIPANHSEIVRILVTGPDSLEIKITSTDLGLELYSAARI